MQNTELLEYLTYIVAIIAKSPDLAACDGLRWPFCFCWKPWEEPQGGKLHLKIWYYSNVKIGIPDEIFCKEALLFLEVDDDAMI